MAHNVIVNRFFEKYGVVITCTGEEDSVEFYGFLQPLRYKNKIYLSGVATELGYDGLNKYLLLAPAEVEEKYFSSADYTIAFNGESFAVDHCEPVYLGRRPLYYWAVVHKEGG